MSDLWVEASTDYMAQVYAERMARAKVAVASLWPFLAQAHTPGDFEHRMNLSMEHIAARLESDPDLVDSTVNSLYADWSALHTAAHAQDAVLTSVPIPRTATINLAPNVTTMGASSGVPMQMFHVASQRWITVHSAAGQSPQNPGYPSGFPEAGPATGETGTYPQHPTGNDRGDPINGPDPTDVIPPAESFPLQPTPWSGGPQWNQQPMNFDYGQHQTTSHLHTQADAYTSEGVQTGPGQNPNYFDQGSQGLTGQGFPQDVSLPEPDERVDMYQNAQGTPTMMGYEQNYLAALVAAINAEAEYHYVKPAEGGGYDVIQKGTGKVLSHHDSQDEAEASFRAMMQSKHSHRLAVQYGVTPAQPRQAQFFEATIHTADMGADNGDMMADNPYSTAGDNPAISQAPTPPPSTQQGGPGAEAGGVDTSASSPSDDAAKQAARRRGHLRTTAEEDYRGRATNQYSPEDNIADEFDRNNWGRATTVNPRQPAEDRRVNTPQQPEAPIPTASSSDRMMQPAQDDEEMDRREGAWRGFPISQRQYGQNGQVPLSRGNRPTSPRAATAFGFANSVVSQSVSRALAAASRRA